MPKESEVNEHTMVALKRAVSWQAPSTAIFSLLLATPVSLGQALPAAANDAPTANAGSVPTSASAAPRSKLGRPRAPQGPRAPVPGTGASAGAARTLVGLGDPDGRVAGAVGDVYERIDGAPGQTLYVNQSGENTGVGWTAK